MSRRTCSAMAVTGCLALAASGCSRGYASLSPAQVCASDSTLGRVKHAVFDQAAMQASSQTRYALDKLSQDVQAKLVRPLVESYDHDTHKTSCTADLEVWLPPGVQSPRELKSAIRYDSQPTADGRDVVFNVSGLEQVASGVAGADLGAWAEANAPQKPGLIVEVVPRSAEATRLAQASPPPEPAPAPLPSPVVKPSVVATAAPAPPTRSAPTRSAPTPAPPGLPPPRAPAPVETPSFAQAAPPPAADAPVRVFVHVSDPSRLAAADQVRAQLADLTIAGAPVVTPPVRFVAEMPRRTEVRCLKHADCPAARRVAAYLAQQLGVSVAVIDMSSTYEGDAGVRPGSLELWLRRPDVAPPPE